MQTIDHETGEVIYDSAVDVFNPNMAIQTDTQIIAVSEQALDFTLDLLRAGLALEQVQDLRAKTKALNTLLTTQVRAREARVEASNNLAEARVRIERATGGMIPRLQAEGVLASNGDNRFTKTLGGAMSTLSDFQITRDQSSLWQKLARIPDDIEEDYYATTKEGGGVISANGLLMYAKGLNDQLIQQSNSNEWYTPAKYIEAARRVMGSIDVDPASNPVANEVIKAAEYYTIETNGLDKPWPGNVWLNPPYGKLSGHFVEILIDQFSQGITRQAVVLVNSHATETGWFAPLWNYLLCFTDHRIDFYSLTGAKNGSTHGSVFAYLGDRQRAFYDEFKEFGHVAKLVSYD